MNEKTRRDPSYVCLSDANLTGADMSSFTLTSDDLLGRSELRAVMANALRDAIIRGAAEVKLPYGLTLNKYGIAERTHDTTEVTR